MGPRAEHIWARGEPQGCGHPSTAVSRDLHWDCRTAVLPGVPPPTSLFSTTSYACRLLHHTDAPAYLGGREQDCQKHINLLSDLNFLLTWMKISFVARAGTSNRTEPGCGVQGGDGTVCSLKCVTSAQSTTSSVSYGLRLFPAPNLAFLPAQVSCKGSGGTTGRGLVFSGQRAAPLQFTAKSQINLCDFSLLCSNTDSYNVFLLLL